MLYHHFFLAAGLSNITGSGKTNCTTFSFQATLLEESEKGEGFKEIGGLSLDIKPLG